MLASWGGAPEAQYIFMQEMAKALHCHKHGRRPWERESVSAVVQALEASGLIGCRTPLLLSMTCGISQPQLVLIRRSMCRRTLHPAKPVSECLQKQALS